VPGELNHAEHCRAVIDRAVAQLGGIDILVSNAAFQMSHESIDEISDEEWDYTLATNLSALFHLVKAAVPHMRPGASIIGSSSVNSDMPLPALMPYAATTAGIANMCASWAQLLGPKGIRVNSVAPGPVWTPLIPSTMPEKKVEGFGQEVPLERPGQPAELAPVYVLLASDEASYISGARIAVTGGSGYIGSRLVRHLFAYSISLLSTSCYSSRRQSPLVTLKPTTKHPRIPLALRQRLAPRLQRALEQRVDLLHGVTLLRVVV